MPYAPQGVKGPDDYESSASTPNNEIVSSYNITGHLYLSYIRNMYRRAEAMMLMARVMRKTYLAE
jgi:hypothetical protein